MRGTHANGQAPGQRTGNPLAQPSRRKPRLTSGITGKITLEPVLVLLAGLALAAARLVDSPWVSVATLPAALLAPGHVVIGYTAIRSWLKLDPWLDWGMRVLVSLAVWTVAASLLVVLPGDPRMVGPLIGVWLAVTALISILTAPAEAPGHVWHSAHAGHSADAAAPDLPDLPEPDAGAPGTGGEKPGPRVPWRPVATLVAAAVVVVGSYVGAYAISAGDQDPAPFVAIELSPATGTVYGAGGALLGSAVVRNESGTAISGDVVVRVDGRVIRSEPVSVPEGGRAGVELSGLKVPRCWTRLVVSLIGPPDDVRPRPLTLSGPTAQQLATPLPSPGSDQQFRSTAGCRAT